MAEIIVTIETDGSSNLEVKDVVGQGCEELTKGLERSLGGIEERTHKPERHQHAAESAGRTQQARAGQG